MAKNITVKIGDQLQNFQGVEFLELQTVGSQEDASFVDQDAVSVLPFTFKFDANGQYNEENNALYQKYKNSVESGLSVNTYIDWDGALYPASSIPELNKIYAYTDIGPLDIIEITFGETVQNNIIEVIDTVFDEEKGNPASQQAIAEWVKKYVSKNGGGGAVTDEQIASAVESYFEENPIKFTESDPTVSAWAKEPTKPTYTASEVGALPANTKIPVKTSEIENDSGFLDKIPDEYVTEDELNKKGYLTKAPVTSVNGKTGAVSLSASDVKALPDTYTPPDQTAAQVGADPKGTADAKVSEHNTSNASHNDIRLLIENLTTRLNALADSTDTDLDQLSEIVTYIKSNKELIEGVTTNKVNVSDIIDNLTTNVASKPLSAAQGVALKALIDAITVPTKLSELSGDSTHRVVTDAEKTAWNAKSNFSGAYDDLTGKPTNVSAFNNDAGYIKDAELEEAVDSALEFAKGSGEFDGDRGFSILRVTTALSSYTTTTGGFTPKYRIALSTVLSESGASEVLVGDTILRNYYTYRVGYVDSSYVYVGAYASIRGAAGKSAYAYAQDGGYTGTEEAFAANMAREIPESISLGIASDGLVYVFVNGNPVGTGIPQGQSGDLLGYIDENNIVVLKGDLADGTYSIKYEMDDGEIVNIGNLVLDSTVYYSVTSNLTNCTINNSTKQIAQGESYSATITANSGYELKSVTATMGGSAVTVTNGVINIASVTGNIVITAVAEVVKTETNFAEYNSTNTSDWSIWINNARAGSDGTYRSDTYNSAYGTPVVSNYIAVQNGDIIEFKGFYVQNKNSITYTSSKALRQTGLLTATNMASEISNVSINASNYSGQFTINNSAVGYVRIGGYVGHKDFPVSDISIKIKRNGAYL